MKNAERTALTRGRLIAVSRALFAEHGYAGTSTEAILQGVALGRGALYHHFRDKAELFEAVCQQICEEAVPVVDAAAARGRDAVSSLVLGSLAWVDFMTRPEVRQIIVVDAPTVLGWERWDALDRKLSYASLRDGLRSAIAAGELKFGCTVDMATTLVNGSLNAIALRAGAPASRIKRSEWERAVRTLFEAFRP